jgi:hypothetical protein
MALPPKVHQRPYLVSPDRDLSPASLLMHFDIHGSDAVEGKPLRIERTEVQRLHGVFVKT